MGAAVSEPVTHADLQDKTIRTRALMDVILQYMLNQVSIKDFATLSNPAECKKYVVFMANNLFQYFHKIRVLPVMDARGFLAFRKMDDLQKDQEKMSKDQEVQKQSLCLSLSYFYTRIFQIYGALALTLIDDVQYMSTTGAVKLVTTDYLSTPGESTPIARPRPRMGGGGPGKDELGNFFFLDPILDRTMSNMGYAVAHKTYKTSKDEMYFRLTDKEKKSANDDIQEGRFAISYPGIGTDFAKYYITARRVPSSPEIIVTFGELTYVDKNGIKQTEVPGEKVVTHTEIRIIPNNAQPPEFVMKTPPHITRTGEPMKAVAYMIARLDKVLDHVKTRVGTVTTSGVASTSATTTSNSFDEIGVDPHLLHTRLRANLTKERPPGHCIARALQLLRTPVLSGAEGVSYICKIQFYETSKGSDRGGLPSPGGILTAPSKSGDKKPGSAGLAAFSQLFYDVVSTGTPKLMIGIKKGAAGQPSSFEQYTRFMRLMSHIFEDNESAPGKERTDAELQTLGLDGLRNKRDDEKCRGVLYKDDIIPVSADVSQKVQKVVQELFKIQFNHATECGRIMGMLFDIKYDKEKNPTEIGFSSNLLKQGFPELERINYLAREVLLKYYARCEGTYQQGMNMVLDDHKKRRTKKAAAELGVQVAAKPVQATQATPVAARNPKGELVAPGAAMALAPPAPTLQSAPSAPAALQTGPPLLQLTHNPTTPLPQTRKKGGTRKRSSHKAVTASKR